VFALGPLRFGTLFETTAMPEVRTQARDLALTLVASLAAQSTHAVLGGDDAVASAI
jgi:uncharacterized NAD(P)/FAD-binding protein YdhS